jgi:hypothetical protein
LTDRFPLWLLPIDSLRVLYESGMVREVGYRPSRLTRLRQREQALSSEEVIQAGRLCAQQVPQQQGVVVQATAEVLDLAADCLLYTQVRKSGREDPADPELGRLLATRNRLPAPSSDLDIPVPGMRPDQGHGSTRLQAALGIDAGHTFWQVGYRPALHALLDPPAGYQAGAQIEVLQSWLRFMPQDQQLTLEAIELADVLSVPRTSPLVDPLAWRVRLAWQRMDYGDAGRRLSLLGESGIGTTLWTDDRVLAYALGEAALLAAEELEPNLNLGLGARVELQYHLADALALDLSATVRQYLADSPPLHYDCALQLGLAAGPRGQLFVRGGYGRQFGSETGRLMVGWSWFW